MPKIKTNRAAAKRFKKTATGKLKHKRAFQRHILSTKKPSRKRRLRQSAIASPGDARKLKRLLPYL